MNQIEPNDYISSHRAVLRPAERRLQTAALVLVLLFWMWVGSDIFTDVRAPKIAVGVWALFGGLILLELAWQVLGVLTISLEGARLVTKSNIGPLPLPFGRVFDISDIGNARVEERQHRGRGNKWTEWVVTVEHKGKQRLLMGNLSRMQAESLLALGPLKGFAAKAGS